LIAEPGASNPSRRRVVVIGAGAAGSMAAIFAATSGAETLLLERTADGGRKILISGGGRCNILPARVDESRFVTDSSPHLLRKIVRSWPLREQVAFFEKEMGIPLAEEQESAKLFPVSNRARDVRDGLLDLAARRGATVMTGTTVTDYAPGPDGWRIEREGGPPLLADADTHVVEAALINPRLREEDLTTALRRDDARTTLVEAAAASTRWAPSYAVKLAIVLQPRTPLPLVLERISSLVPRDLRRLALDPSLRPLIQAAARKVIEQESETS